MPPEVGTKVATTFGAWIAGGAWATFLAVSGGIIMAVIRQWGPWKKQASDDRAADFDRLREDIAAAKADSKEAREDARKASDSAQRLENMVACMRPAISILTAEVRRLDPNSESNAAIIQVQDLMAMAATGDLGLARGLVALSTVKGTLE